MTGGIDRVTLLVDVAGHAPSGCRTVSTDLFVPSELEPDPVMWCCVPGGGSSRAYFDLDVPPSLGQYSMAKYLAGRGPIVLTIDPPGVGESDLPDDGYELTPRVLADVLHFVVGEVHHQLAVGQVPGVPAISCRSTVGVGHSAGGLLVACQQARHRTYGAVALLGFSGTGLPSVLNESETAFIDRAEDLVAVLPEFVRMRFGDPLPQWSSAPSELEQAPSFPPEVQDACSRSSSRLLAMVGMSAIIPGSIGPELNQIDVPTIVAFGERDIAGNISALPGQLPACRDLTLFVLAGSGHNHNVAPSRIILWDRLLQWAQAGPRRLGQ
jgi:pimeloyl-ACP methyl ester carboxylesterase